MVSATRSTFPTTSLRSHCSNRAQAVCLSALSRRLSHYGVRRFRSSSENTSTRIARNVDVPPWNHELPGTARSQRDECWRSCSRFVRWQRRKHRLENCKNTLSKALIFFSAALEIFSWMITKLFVISRCSSSRALVTTNQNLRWSFHQQLRRQSDIFFRVQTSHEM